MLTVFRVAFGALAAVKALQLTTKASISFEEGISLADQAAIALPLGAVMLVAALFFILGRGVRRAAMAMLVGFLVFVIALDFYNHHTYLISVVCAIFVLGLNVPQLLKLQLAIVYTFAALTKVNETYLSGSELYASMVQHLFWQTVVGVDPEPAFLIAVSVASIVVEAFLAVGLWFARTRRITLVIGLCFHLSLVVLVTAGFDLFLDLAIYGGVMLSLYLPFFEEEINTLVRRNKAPVEQEPSPAQLVF
ncbi:HTTM domain-containing protein [Rhodococcus sp. IEGM 1408]|uniref:HTTM domain-containing protein n=1 Tax=Rhodococcus sp. IEGM 1408 TaxID=3082220 RepID=UPI0029534B29|nr:HTTM domain-containing protein [Rhodococcus sp. IEGM 1408]MDV7999894.1 HTTM domain-containing protein [Rhodococcus sp. IEGM 1408]